MRGGDRNNRFDRAQASSPWLVWKFNWQKITCAKPATEGSTWNQAERPISSLKNASHSAALCRKLTNTDLEKDLSKMKGPNALMKSNHTEEIKEACM